ncbi:hypothetical protein RSOLAG22IIIB_08218 [Rhizoctonia solani]|uniref:Uncharacterized protein n=1 Tax=Rhizoctonia solani TaxID=456999 RepID=A0A0K6FRT2_9AGAM|nr:hypothetical protein RSOLAG22IIIB_08218 [Rhizoctonia solani]
MNPQTMLVTALLLKDEIGRERGWDTFLFPEYKVKDWEIKLSKIARSGTLINQLELLVPIRLGIDFDHFRLKDTFTWDLSVLVCDDYQISPNSVVQAVAKSITEQLQEHHAHIVEPASGPRHEEVRGEMSEAEFVEVYSKELRLGGEFKTVVAHSIREQVSVHQKSPFPIGHPFDSTPIVVDELRTAMLPPIDHSLPFDYTLLEQLTPQLDVLQEAEIEHSRTSWDRATRPSHVSPCRRFSHDCESGRDRERDVTRADADGPMHIPERTPVLMHHQQQQQQQQHVPPPQPPKQQRQRTGILQPPPLPNRVFISRSADPAPSTGLDSDAAARARADFGGAEPEGPASPTKEDDQQAILTRVLEYRLVFLVDLLGYSYAWLDLGLSCHDSAMIH